MNKIKFFINKLHQFQELGLIVVVIVMCIAASFLSDVFFSIQNLLNILTQSTMAGIAGLGAAIILLTGEIDLSIGSLMAGVGIATVSIGNATGSVTIGILSGILTGIIVCVINATIVLKIKINSFIATLAMMSIIRGAVMVVTKASSIQNQLPAFEFIGMGQIGWLPFPVLLLAILAVFVYVILNRTSFGRAIYAVGSNKEAALLSGINVQKIKYFVYGLEGVFIAIAAQIMASRLNSGQPLAGTGFELNVISAVILGGVSMTGGRGKIAGALLGILILNILTNALVLLNVSSFYQQIARGIVLIFAVFFDERRRVNMSKRLLTD
jgi:ribose transport system permease protein